MPKPLINMIPSDEEIGDDSRDQSNKNMVLNPTFKPGFSQTPHLLTQAALNDLIRDFNLSKKQAELLSSRIKILNIR